MKRNSVVVFPDTVPAAQVLIPLVLVFEPVVYCQPVENDDSGQPLDTRCAAMVERSLCSLQSPAPLGENRERFLHLVNDLQQRRDDYAAQLTHVSLAGISTGSQPSTESKSSILSSLLSGHGIDSAEQEQKEKLLWQARLVLKLGEQYDVDQQKIAADMKNIHQREQNLFAGMSREAGSPFSLTGKLTSLVSDADGMQHLRLKAWARLFAFGSSSMGGARFFVSAKPDAVDRLGEEYERKFGSRPSVLLTLPLPACCPDEKGFPEQLQQFLDDDSEILANLSSILDEPSTISKEQRIMFSEQGSAWSALVDRCFPEQDYGRCQLVLYTFSKAHITQLFLDSFGHDEDDLQADLVDGAPQDVVIGLLEEQ